MDMTLQKFMGLAITAVIIGALIFGAASMTLKGQATKHKDHLQTNMNEVIRSEMNK